MSKTKKMLRNPMIFSIILLIAAFFFCSYSNTAWAADVSSTPKVIVNGDLVTFDVLPVIEHNRVMVPLRAIFESMGTEVAWNNASKSVTAVFTEQGIDAKQKSTTVILKIGSKSPKINGTFKQIDVPAKMINGRTFVPLRFVGEAFGGSVKWDDRSYTASIINEEAAVNKISAEIISNLITPKMNELQKELAIHDYLLKTVYLDYENYDGNTAYSALVNKRANPSGITKAANILLNLAGIDTKVVNGSAELSISYNDGSLSHLTSADYSWNIVNINDQYYHLDVVADMPTRGHLALTYECFNMTDQEAAGYGFLWDKGKYVRCNKEFPLRDKLSGSIYHDNDYVYYTENSFDGNNGQFFSQIKRIKLNGYGDSSIQYIYSFNRTWIAQEGPWIYYTYLDYENFRMNNDTSYLLMKTKMDGTDTTLIAKIGTNQVVNGFRVKDGWCYIKWFNAYERISADGLVRETITTGEDLNDIYYISSDWVYHSRNVITEEIYTGDPNTKEYSGYTVYIKVHNDGTGSMVLDGNAFFSEAYAQYLHDQNPGI